MFITGVGIGPTLAVFTIIVQNAVPFSELGTATSNLVFFRQIGGSVGLAIAGTVFATALRDKLPAELTPVFQQIRSQVPPQLQAQFDQVGSGLQNVGGGLNLNTLTGVGQSFGRAMIEYASANAGASGAFVRQLLTPYIPQLDAAFHQAFSLAIGTTFVVAIGSTIVALLAATAIKEEPLRRTVGARAPAGEPVAAEAGTAR
jgi:hypothetical protein